MKTTQWYGSLASLIFVASAGMLSSLTYQQLADASIANPTSTTHRWIQVASIPQPVPPAESLPSQALIFGVPFIPLGEAKQLRYAHQDIVNPSIAAAEGMILKYWGQDLKHLQDVQNWKDWATVEGYKGKSIEALKPWISRGIPVIVSPVALTPVAHTLERSRNSLQTRVSHSKYQSGNTTSSAT